MAATISFLAGQGAMVPLAGSGLGFYGSSFGTSIQVGQYQDSTFITSSDGSVQGPAANNLKKAASTSGVTWNGSVDTTLQDIPNASGTVNVRFTFDSAVKTQNGEVRVYSSSAETGESEESVPAEYQGPDMEIGFNATYLLDFLRAVDTDRITFELKDQKSAGEMRPAADDTSDHYRYVVMPMRI